MRPIRLIAPLALTLVAGSCSDGPTGPNVGTLELAVSGLPAGAEAAITVTSLDSTIARQATGTTSLADLPPGRYSVSTSIVEAALDAWSGPAAFEVRVSRGKSVPVAVAYTLASGRIQFTATGLPPDATALLNLTGPDGATREVQVGAGTAIARGLVAGSWSIAPTRATGGGHSFDAAPVSPVQVDASETPVAMHLAYTVATGALSVTFTGLPVGVQPLAILSGPTGPTDTLTASGTVTGLPPATYSIVPQLRLDDDIQYRAPIVPSSVTIGLTPLDAVVEYTPRSGRIAISATGLPDGFNASVRVTGPAGYDRLLTDVDTLKGVPNGNYQLQGVMVPVGAAVYGTGDPVQVVVTGANTSYVPLVYVAEAAFNVAIDGAYLVQASQRYDGTVPLVAGRKALLRVFGLASAPNAFTPPLHARIAIGPSTLFETLVTAPVLGVPMTVNQSNFAYSWNAEVPGTAIQPGVTLQLTLDPDEALPEANRVDNVVHRALDVRALPPFRARFVPIQWVSTGTAGNIMPSNASQFLRLTRDMLPMDSIDYDIRAPLATNQPFLETSVQSTWSAVLNELNTLRVAEGTGRHYMGIIKVAYNRGIAGMAYLSGLSSLTWDYLPSGSSVLAHELGHNLSRAHAPCGGPAGVDGGYPYPDADIGVFGWDQANQEIKLPTAKDIMSYCRDEWISDYTFNAILTHRQNTESFAVAAANPQPALVVRGRIDNGQLVLDPAFRLTTRAELPSDGPHRLEFRDEAGRTIYAASFAGQRVTHVGDETDEHFAFAIPITVLGGREPAAFTVTARGQRAELLAPALPAVRVDGRAAAARQANGAVRVTWSDPAARGLIIRDAATSQIITIVTGTSAVIPARTGEIEVLASDGLRTTSHRVRLSAQ